MLALRSLVLSHFRSHKFARLNLDPRPVAIWGPNGAGKTNLIEAVSMLSPGRGLRGAGSEDIAHSPDRIGWKVAVVLEGPTGVAEIATRSEGAGRRVEVDGKAAPQTALGEVARLLWLTPAMDRLWSESAGGRRRFLDRLTLSLVPDHGEVAIAYDRGLRERNRLIRDEVRDGRWFDAVEARMAEAGARLTANRRRALGRVAVMPQAGFPAATLTLATDGPEAAQDLVAALRDGRRRDIAAGRSLVGPHRDDLQAVYSAKDMPARLCSTGEQKALLISVVLANARAVAGDFGAPPLLLLDEVAAHLDADRRAALFGEILALGAQAWMTGTGADLFAGLGERAQGFHVTEADGASMVSPEPVP